MYLLGNALVLFKSPPQITMLSHLQGIFFMEEQTAGSSSDVGPAESDSGRQATGEREAIFLISGKETDVDVGVEAHKKQMC